MLRRILQVETKSIKDIDKCVLYRDYTLTNVPNFRLKKLLVLNAENTYKFGCVDATRFPQYFFHLWRYMYVLHAIIHCFWEIAGETSFSCN